MMQLFAPERLGPNQSKTPEGFLLCANVPIARTGVQTYLEGEIDKEIKGDAQGVIKVLREASEVFAPDAIASFQGKPVTLLHPDDDVTPANWRQLAMGHLQNVRRGTGADSDLLLADVLITSPEAIAWIRPADVTATQDALTLDGALVEVSCGYTCDYEQTAPGFARQRIIRGNHLALVRHGRAGHRCAIKDKDDQPKENAVANDTGTPAPKPKARAGLIEAFKKMMRDAGVDPDEDPPPDKKASTVDAAEFEQVKADVKQIKDGMGALTKLVTDAVSAPSGDDPDKDKDKDKDKDDPDKKPLTGDALRLFNGHLAALAPGMQCGTRDSLTTRASLMQHALLVSMADPAVTALLGGKTPAQLTADALPIAFNAAAALARANILARQTTPRQSTNDAPQGVRTAADVNAANAAFWAKQRQGG